MLFFERKGPVEVPKYTCYPSLLSLIQNCSLKYQAKLTCVILQQKAINMILTEYCIWPSQGHQGTRNQCISVMFLLQLCISYLLTLQISRMFLGNWTSDCHCHVVWKRAQRVRLSFFLSFFYSIFRAIFCAKSVIDWGIKKGNLPLLWMPAACLGSNRWVKAPKSLTAITRDEIGQKRSKIFIIISYHIFFSRKQF